MMSQASANAAVVRQLEELEAHITSALAGHDCAGWGAFLADDWTVTHVNAQIITKTQALEMCRSGPGITYRVDQVAVRSYGDMAIVTGRTVATTVDGSMTTVRLRFTDVCVRRGDRWIVVASHATRIPD
jgi:ketosteroid isomerase-like protein